MTSNPLLQAWRAGRPTLGVWCTIPSSVTAEFVSRQGPDYVCVDYQHGLIDHSAGVTMLQGIAAGGSVPIARVGWNEPARIMAVLDAGAEAVVVPMVGTAEEARRAAAACSYPPTGMRSFGPVRAKDTKGSTDPDDLADVACIVMIETADGIANMAAIAQTPGVDAVYIGPNDLGLALGLSPSATVDDPKYREVVAQIVTCCHDNGIAVGVHAPNGDLARAYVEDGFDMVTVATDAAMLAAATATNLRIARAAATASAPTSLY